MKYFFYIVRSDTGFAPNPFYGFCTLATCKPKIREATKNGDWIIGFHSRAKNISPKYRGKLVYAMKVKKLAYNKYWENKDFQNKKYSDKNLKRKCGDNIYHKDLKGNWIQEKNQFHNGEKIKKHDTQTNAVLISNNFFYFGKKYVQLPEYFEKLVNNLPRGHKYKGMEIVGKKLIKFLEKKYKKGKLYGKPIGFKDIENKCQSEKRQRKNKPKVRKSSFKLYV